MQLNHQVFEEICNSLKNKKSAQMVVEVEGKTYVRKFFPKERLIILGGGHVALPLAQIAVQLDFSVIVVDDREEFANTTRFNTVDEVICDTFRNAIEKLQITEHDYVCVITRGHMHDVECVRQIMDGTMPKYLGMIGSKHKVAAVIDLLHEEGYSEELIEKMEAPIGYNIHAVTTPEIAISILAQIIEYRRRDYKKNLTKDFMAETTADFHVLETLARFSEPISMALILKTQGSTPGKEGSMIAVNQDGLAAGTIGGGSGEAEIIRLARSMGDVKKMVAVVDMMGEQASANKMICGGKMTVLIETIE